jgi:uncharacterized protein YheU (UPF0270 family)
MQYTKEFQLRGKKTKIKKPLGAGKKTKAWDEAREKLKKQFAAWGITKCELNYEGCWRDNSLGFAHLDKRRYLTEADLMQVVLACNECHQTIEVQSREEMRKELEEVIKNRVKNE